MYRHLAATLQPAERTQSEQSPRNGAVTGTLLVGSEGIWESMCVDSRAWRAPGGERLRPREHLSVQLWLACQHGVEKLQEGGSCARVVALPPVLGSHHGTPNDVKQAHHRRSALHHRLCLRLRTHQKWDPSIVRTGISTEAERPSRAVSAQLLIASHLAIARIHHLGVTHESMPPYPDHNHI